MKALRKKLQLIFLALIISIVPIISQGCKDDEVDWGFVIFIIRVMYYEHGVDPEGFARKARGPQITSLPTPSGSIRTDITDKGAAADTGTGTGGGGGHC